MEFSKGFVRLNWLALIFIYLVIFAGSFVRITGSGMGCPDWPKCFGQWVPPTAESALPKDYKEIYSQKRDKKITKFCKFLKSIGLEATAEKIQKDPKLLLEEDFNARKTWTEYVNRLMGFLAGNAMLFAFIWMLWKYRTRKLAIVMSVNLVFLLVNAWFGSIVVASNLVPWTITVHMFLALAIIILQIYTLRIISPRLQKNQPLPKYLIYLIWICLAITFYQMFLGTQVREDIDVLRKSGIPRIQWTDYMGWSFLVHRSFSWFVLVLILFIAWKNEKIQTRYPLIRLIFITLALELISGVLLAYADMPGLVQTSHLIFASMLFGILFVASIRYKSAT